MKRVLAIAVLLLLTLCACATPAPTDQSTPVPPTLTPEVALYPDVNLPTLGKLSLNAHAVEHAGRLGPSYVDYFGAGDVRADFFSRPDSFMLRVRATDAFLPVNRFFYTSYQQHYVDGMLLDQEGDSWRIPMPSEIKEEVLWDYMAMMMQEVPDSHILRDVEILDIYHAGEALSLAQGDIFAVAEYAQYGPKERRLAPAFYYYDPATLAEVFAPENCGVYGSYMVSDAEYVIVGYGQSVTRDPSDFSQFGVGVGGGTFPPITDARFAQVKGHFCIDEELLAAGVAGYGRARFPHHYYYVSDEELDAHLDANPDFDGMTPLQQRLDYWRQENAQQVLDDYFAAVESTYEDGGGDYFGPMPRPTLPSTPVE